MRNPDARTIRTMLAPIRCFLLDMDGTIYLDDVLLPGALDFLRALEQTGRETLFLTNNSSRGSKDYYEKLERLRVPPSQRSVLTSGEATALWLRTHHPGKRVYVMGNTKLRSELASLGITLDETAPELVLVGFDTELTYAKLCATCDFVRAGLPYIATHPDFNCPTATGFIPDCGAMLELIRASTARFPDEIIGKPYAGMAVAACARTGLPAQAHAMVGDRLYTDIAFGAEHGMLSILVLTGETKESDLSASPTQPHLMFAGVREIIPYL